MRTWVIRFGAGLLLLAIAAVVGLMVWEPLLARPGKAPPPRAYRAEIVRDEWGVPHIYGKTDADVAYGVAQAHAEDDFRTLQDVVAMTRGRYGAIAGEDGAQFDYVLALLDARGTVNRQYATLAPRTRALLEAYATGLNDYAAAHPGEVELGSLFPVNGAGCRDRLRAAPAVLLRAQQRGRPAGEGRDRCCPTPARACAALRCPTARRPRTSGPTRSRSRRAARATA